VLVIKFNPFPEEELLAKVIHRSKFWKNVGSLLFFELTLAVRQAKTVEQ
jgi:hypothetical protein